TKTAEHRERNASIIIKTNRGRTTDSRVFHEKREANGPLAASNYAYTIIVRQPLCAIVTTAVTACWYLHRAICSKQSPGHTKKHDEMTHSPDFGTGGEHISRRTVSLSMSTEIGTRARTHSSPSTYT
ncbi:unnamed protein product, partial [Ectocarpus sp. 12 AP-2014]